MKVINFTTNEIKGTTQKKLIFDSSIVSNLSKGKSVNIVAGTVFRQIEAEANSDSIIVLELPIWLSVEVEMILAKYDAVKEVFYFLDNVLLPSPLLAKYKSLIAEKSILQNICNEQQDLAKTA